MGCGVLHLRVCVDLETWVELYMWDQGGLRGL